MNDTLSALSDWLGQNPQWIPLTLGLTALIESAAMIGVVIPGVAVLYAASALAGVLDISLAACIGAAALGAFIGDVASFYLGRYAHRPALRVWPFKQHPDWIIRGERFIQRHGIPSVVIGRFVGPIRPVLPFVAGMLAMPPQRFIPVNALSAMLWSPAYILPGYLFGRLAEAGLDAPQNSPWLNLLLLVIIAGGLITLGLLHRGLSPGSAAYQKLDHHPTWQQWRSPLSGELPLTSMALGIVALTTFVAIALTVTLGNPLAPLDQAITALFRNARTPEWDSLVVLITSFGDSANLLPLSLLIALFLWYRGDRAGALHWIGAMLLLALLNHLTKTGFALPRPDYLLQPLSSYSFPSAHSSNSTLFFALCACWLAQSRPYHQRLGIYALATLPAAAICLSRLYLGVHWLTDVIGGVCLALTVCAATRFSHSRWQQPVRFRRSGLVLLLGASLWTTLYLCWRYPSALVGYTPIPL
ncbi:bifunctional DedA family/phosphatase PAP2 family protein [Motiliproteus sediminis]|uniref:bifunctional DedA family/phosphatase PAP2 family protein n=1 Tax=Motiliproteus sediminis TaxID=1468178 RepID=UPI001AEFF7A2|nr:bifunctional DedA family/phosphatase PAP2 family protein [Motiliproteus sediminis]